MIFSFLGVTESKAFESLRASVEGTFDIIEFETVEEMGDEFAMDYLVVDYDSDPQIAKTLKKVKKSFPEVFLILLSNKLSSKDLIKHQNGKLAADVYLRTPISLESLLKILDLELDEEVVEISESSEKAPAVTLTEAQKEIIMAHMPGHEVSYEAKVLSDEIQELFDEVYIPKNFLTQDASSTLRNLTQSSEEEMDDGLDLLDLSGNDEEEALPDLPLEVEDESNQIEEPIMAQHQKKDELDLEEMSLDLSSDETAGELSLSTEEDALSLDMGLGSDDDLELSGNEEEEVVDDSLSLSGETLGGLELSEDTGLNLAEEFSLNDDDSSLENDERDDLSLGESLDNGLELSSGDDLDLSSADDELELSSGGDELDLGVDDDLDFSQGDDLPLDSEEGLELSEESDLDLSLGDEILEEGEEEGLDFGAMDELTSEESDLDFSIENSELESDENDGLDLFGDLPSSPEIDALNLDDEGEGGSVQEDLSEDAIEKLKEIDHLMSGNEEEVEDAQAAEEVASYDFSSDEEKNTSEPETQLSSTFQKEHSEVMQHHHHELDRLGVTLSEMRQDRNLLLEELEKVKNLMEDQKREMLTLRSELDERKIENSVIRKRYEKQVEDLKFQLDLSNEKKTLLEVKNREFEQEYQKLNQKVRIDIKKIQTREKELESQIELLRADSEIQIKNRDQKILELKRKIDSLEFDLESVQVNERRSVTSKHDLEDKMDRVIKTLRLAIGELEEGEASVRTLEKIKKSLDV